MGSSRTAAAGTCRPTITAAASRAPCAPTASTAFSCAAPAGRRRRTSTPSTSSAARLARVPWTHEVEVLLHTPLADAAAPFPATLAELEPFGDDTLLRMRAESLDWVAGVLAGAGCAFTIRRPDELRASVQALGERLLAASRGLRDRRARDTDLQGTRE